MSISLSRQRRAFTLIEVLISIGLLGIVLVALFSTVSMMRDSNEHLHTYLEKAKKVSKATKVLYLDILSSDGNITIKKDEFSRICMESTRNSLYGLSVAKVCWVVLKKENTLARVEGNAYSLPTRFEDRVEVNTVMKNIDMFDVYHQKDKVLVILRQKGKEAITFLVQGITKPVVKKVVKKKKPKTKRTSNIKKPVKTRANPQKPTQNHAKPNQNEIPNLEEGL